MATVAGKVSRSVKQSCQSMGCRSVWDVMPLTPNHACDDDWWCGRVRHGMEIVYGSLLHVLVPTLVYERDLEHEQNRRKLRPRESIRCRLHRDGGLKHNALNAYGILISCNVLCSWRCWVNMSLLLMMMMMMIMRRRRRRRAFMLYEDVLPWLWTHWCWRDDNVAARTTFGPCHLFTSDTQELLLAPGKRCVQAVWPISFPAAFPCHLLGHRFPRNTLVARGKRGKRGKPQDSPRMSQGLMFYSDGTKASLTLHQLQPCHITMRPTSTKGPIRASSPKQILTAWLAFHPWEVLRSRVMNIINLDFSCFLMIWFLINTPDLINLILQFLHFLRWPGIFQHHKAAQILRFS